MAAQAGRHYSAWEPAQKIDEIDGNNSELNTPFQDGCPIQSPDGRSLYMASNRPGGKGLLDIWVARRPNRHAPWGAPENLGEPVNSAADDFCPTPIKNDGLFFVSREALPGSCGLGDIYFTRYSRRARLERAAEPRLRARRPEQRARRAGTLVRGGRPEGVPVLLAELRDGPGDIYVSKGFAGWGFGPATAVTELNDPVGERHPAERAEGRARGRLLVEPRGHARRPGHLGRDAASVHHPWSVPVNLGAAVNTAAAESRPSLSRNARQLLFGRAPGPEGIGDIYVTTPEGPAARTTDLARSRTERARFVGPSPRARIGALPSYDPRPRLRQLACPPGPAARSSTHRSQEDSLARSCQSAESCGLCPSLSRPGGVRREQFRRRCRGGRAGDPREG